MSLDTLNDLFIEQLRDTLNAEKQLVKALPKMSKNANSEMLSAAFASHLEETKVHVARLEQVFDLIEEPPRGKKCKGMEGLLEEGQEAMEEDGDPAVIDAGMIAAAQRVEHYEMAAYGCLVHYAELLGYKEAAKLLQKTLNEEKAADEKLTKISDAEVLSAALSAGEEEEVGV